MVGREFTAEDREKARLVKAFKKELTNEAPTEPVTTPQAPVGAPLDRMERLLEQQVRIKSMMKFMRDMDKEDITPQEKKSDLDMFKQFIETQDTITSATQKREKELRDSIVEQMSEAEFEPESTEDVLLKTLISKIGDGSINIGKENTPNISPPQTDSGSLGSSAPVETNMMKQTDTQIIDAIPSYVKDAIKSGGLTMDAVKTGLKEQGKAISPEEDKRLEKIYKKIQGKKK